jgi:hypothetical protein
MVIELLSFSVFLEQIIECLDGQGVDRGVSRHRQHSQSPPAVHAHSSKDLLKGIRIVSGGRPLSFLACVP